MEKKPITPLKAETLQEFVTSSGILQEDEILYLVKLGYEVDKAISRLGDFRSRIFNDSQT
jgi:hypothetical protein